MAIVVTSKGTASGTSGTATVGSLTITAGNSIIVGYATRRTTTSTLVCKYNDGTDDYDLIAELSAHNNNTTGRMYHIHNVVAASGSGSIIATDSFGDSIAITVYEVSGLDPAGTFDKKAAATGRTTTPSSGATDTTTQDDELVAGLISCADDTTNGTWNGTVTDNNQAITAGGDISIATATKIVSTTGEYVCSKTEMTKEYWGAGVITFKATSAAADNAIFLGTNF